MIAQSYIPQPPLNKYIDVFWLYEDYTPTHVKERVLPSGTVELVINLRDDMIRIYEPQSPEHFQQFRGCVLSGAHSEFLVIDTVCQASIIGVHFKPGGAFPFVDMPVDALTNSTVSLETLWGHAAMELRDQLMEATTPQRRFQVLERFLLFRLADSLTLHPAVAFALQEFQRIPHLRTMAVVAESLGFSSRRFIELFRHEVGLTPKRFCRIQRFQKVLRCIENGGQIAWADVAASCGYFDQAHCINDFRAFSGLNPTTYCAQNVGHRNHVPL
ncbi:MAG: AraC family transcriptional regulator [Chloroflexi bacterium AL-W]|nr:AraC family transcriptional regulator [Chloroflexi bacterium AL-N1]NOK66516.1 AraC family transcriptional regulator [Chloroflexi bacterium AL-N10]NOK71904.1 AraC family transcriptional regulator [Chloroflexi bacterium AL-N5]NOK81161.1 AraC family transcriptional regulator [Chloroflexi bacterium AL-W]NOK89434.1 AraC family transcriptional regulator [Chloroflexi bacterium AL-N15]